MDRADDPPDARTPAADGVDADDATVEAGPVRTTWLQRFLDNKTGPQRLVMTLGALAGALIAIGGVVTALVRIVDGDDGGASGNLEQPPGETQRIDSGTAAADAFVQELLEHDGGTVALDHQVVAEKGPADVRLRYDCDDAGVCLMTRLQDVVVAAGVMPDGLWFEGCFAVTRVGRGYGAEPLDIALKYQGPSCPDRADGR